VRWAGPALLIILGLALLLANFSLLPPIAWRSLGVLWPILLIVLGVELIATGRISWAGVLGGVAVLLVLAVVAGALGFPAGFRDSGRPIAEAEERRVEQALNGARAAEIAIDQSAGRLDVTGGAREGLLAEAVAMGGRADTLQGRYTVRDGVGRLHIDVEGPEFWLFRGTGEPRSLQVRLGQAIPLQRIEINGGATDLNVDLTGLRVERLELSAGASNGRVRLPAQGRLAAEVSAGASSLAIEVPPGVAARIRSSGGLAGFDVDEQRFPVVGGDGIPGLAGQREYRSPDFDTAANRVDLQVSAGAASISVR
jgi:hypothetical protein